MLRLSAGRTQARSTITASPSRFAPSVNEVICHGIPDDRVLREGEIVNCDITVFLDGFHGDCSETVGVGAIDSLSKELVTVTYDCLMRGIDVVKPGMIRDIGREIEARTRLVFSVVRAFVGHGIGQLFHMDPQVPHYFDPGSRFEFRPGMTFTIEPMINVGAWTHETWDDQWTAISTDRLRSAQFEHTLLVTDTGTEILTARLDGSVGPRGLWSSRYSVSAIASIGWHAGQSILRSSCTTRPQDHDEHLAALQHKQKRSPRSISCTIRLIRCRPSTAVLEARVVDLQAADTSQRDELAAAAGR